MVLKKGCALKKLSVMALVLIIVFSLLTGCTVNNKESVNENISSTEKATQSSTTAQVTAPRLEKLTIALSSLPIVENYDTNYFTKMVENDMNIDFEFILLPSNKDDAKTKFSLMVSSGSKLPDVLNMPIGKMVALDYASKGIFVKLNDYLADPVLAKNFLNIPKKDREYVYQNLKLADGNIYSLFSFTPFEWNEARNRFWINKTWLQKMNMNIANP